MSTRVGAARLLPMDNAVRAAEVKRRADAMGLFQVREFERATERVDRKVPRASITKALRGEATAVIYDRLEAALDLLEESMAHDEPESAGEQVEIEVRDIVGIGQVIFRGPVGDMPQFEAMLERLIERQRRQGG